jgi:hypothetical protein
VGNRLTENAKRSHLAIWAALGCRDCITVTYPDARMCGIHLDAATHPGPGGIR